MSDTQRPLELDLLCQKLDSDFSNLIVGAGKSDEAKRSNFLSKAIAAFVLSIDAGATLDIAVKSSIDGGLDHGIDSVYIANDQTIWLVQSKYKSTGVGEPELGDVSKFRDGVSDLLHGRFDRFNGALQKRQAEIANALNSEHAKVKVILAYTGTAIANDKRDIFADLERAFNSTNPDFLQCFAYGLATLHDLHLNCNETEAIEAIIDLQDFGLASQPYKVLYGRMSAKQLTILWNRHQDNLVERNIRKFKGSTVVNKGMQETIEQESEHFFHFNNGVTFLCNSVTEQHPRDANRKSGRFRVRGLSIINGAQTVGAISGKAELYYDANPVEVLATFISLENAPDGFGDKVTQSRNSQNAVSLEDFAALDEKQIILRNTLSLSGIEYLIKRGESDPPLSDNCFDVKELATFLACLKTNSNWPAFIVAAKSDRKKLFGRRGLVAETDPLHQAYDQLFTDSITTKYAWRVVQIGRLIERIIRARARAETSGIHEPSAGEILKHGIWLLMHVVFIKIPLQNGSELTLTEQEQLQISSQVDTIAQKLVDIVQAQVWGKEPRALFENKSDCKTIKGSLMAALAS